MRILHSSLTSRFSILYIRILFTFHFLLFAFVATAQEMEQGEVRHSYLVGAGSGNVLDTYLSPYNYTGANYKFVFESMSPCKIGQMDDLLYNTQLTVDASVVENHTKNVGGYAGGARWNIGVLKHLYTNGNFRLYGGPMANAYIGGVYNERNGNNPAQLKLSVTLDVKAKAMYDFKVWNIPVHTDYSMSIPLAGLAHSPEYGESYYELYRLDDSRNGIVFVHTGNMPSMRHLLTLEVPVMTGHKVRFGYSGDLMQAKINDIKYHSYTHTFMVGLTSTLFRNK